MPPGNYGNKRKMVVGDFKSFFAGKRILITGHTGFKGSWLAIWLHELGANVIGYSLDPYTERDNFSLSKIGDKIVDIRGDIRDDNKLKEVFKRHQPEIIFHLAAQPLVRLSYEQPVETYEINVMGTLNVMEAFRQCVSSKVAIMITTDKCYENKEQIWGYRENEPMGGYDPYSSSKGAAEIAIASWRRSFMNPVNQEQHGKSISSVRAGNVMGGGDWQKDRIIPDCIKAIENNRPIEVRNPGAIRPWQHVLEPLGGYLLLAEKMWHEPEHFSDSWNFGPRQESIADVSVVVNKVIEIFGKGNLEVASNTNSLHESQLLTLDISKAIFRLGWQPKMNLDQTISMTLDWYKNYRNGAVYELCHDQIQLYLTL